MSIFALFIFMQVTNCRRIKYENGALTNTFLFMDPVIFRNHAVAPSFSGAIFLLCTVIFSEVVFLQVPMQQTLKVAVFTTTPAR